MKSLSPRLFCFLFTLTTTLGGPSNLDQIEGSVVLVSGTLPATENVNGTAYELWFRHPVTGEFVPKRTSFSGTGFLVQGRKCLYLVTAKHVALAVGADTDITFRGTSNTPTTLKFSEFIRPSTNAQAFPISWLHHTNADCSAHPLILTSPGVAALTNATLFSIDFFPPLTPAPPRAFTLTTIGFALGKGAQVTFSPITKESKPASGILREGGVDFFYLQDPSIAGFSGAPVVDSGDPRLIAISPRDAATVSGPPKCWGIVSATEGDVSGGKMARVIHSSYITALVSEFEDSFASPPSQNAPTPTNHPSQPARP